uniref:SET domain-containing protein n=1 Tax=Eutreptiella gymnastica TaxID=73025 RepID=A0A7S1J295_9EUGL
MAAMSGNFQVADEFDCDKLLESTLKEVHRVQQEDFAAPVQSSSAQPTATVASPEDETEAQVEEVEDEEGTTEPTVGPEAEPEPEPVSNGAEEAATGSSPSPNGFSPAAMVQEPSYIDYDTSASPSNMFRRNWKGGKSEIIHYPGIMRFSAVERLFDLCVEQCASFEIGKTRNMGYGLFAGRDIQKGEMVLAEKAIMTSVELSKEGDKNAFVDSYTNFYASELGMISHLYMQGLPKSCAVTPGESQSISKYFNSLPFIQRKGLAAKDVVEAFNISRSNFFETSVAYTDPVTEQSSNALLNTCFPFGSMLNHCCAPNLHYTQKVYDIPMKGQMPFGALQLICIANQRIKKGEPLHICYGDLRLLKMPAESRQHFFKSSRGFTCQCSKCKHDIYAAANPRRPCC